MVLDIQEGQQMVPAMFAAQEVEVEAHLLKELVLLRPLRAEMAEMGTHTRLLE